MKVYFISGLGADKRIFKYINLPEGFEPVYLDWIEPQKNESLRSYALRLAENIDKNEPCIILGLSMGGMMAVEIANHIPVQKTIIISSIACSKQLPRYYLIGSKLGLHKLLPIGLIKWGAIMKRFFTKETKEDKTWLKQIIRECDPGFIRWAMGAIVTWENEKIPDNLVHIHGTRDELLPLRYTQPHYSIENGSHMMILTRAGEVSGLLMKVLGN